MTALSFGGAPGVAVLGGDLSQLRRRGGWWRLRDWRLRTKLIAVLLVPLTLAGVLGALRVANSVREADRLDLVAKQMTIAQRVAGTAHDLQRERQLEVAAALGPTTTDPATLPEQQQKVDFDVDVLRTTDAGTQQLGGATADGYRAALRRLGTVRDLRNEMGGPAPATDDVVAGYTAVIAELLHLNRTVLAGVGDPLSGYAKGLQAIGTAKEQISQQRAVLLAGMLSGRLPPKQQNMLRTADARFDAAIAEFNDVATPQQRQSYDTTVRGVLVEDRKRLLETALGNALQNRPFGVEPAQWDDAAAETVDRIRQVETKLLADLRTDTVSRGQQAWHDAVRDAVVVAVLMVLAVLLLLVVVVRSLLRPLRTLRTHAFDVADRRLPDVVDKLRVADDQIGETTVDPVPVYSKEEVGQVARAFDTVHVQAVRLAAEQAMLRGTLNDIFLNLAGRSQVLVERQLNLIDKLESGEQDPEQLSNLFQLDHLATRMRRNSENLLVLAGSELRRGAERAIPVLDMLRAAISEVAEYRRVTLHGPQGATVKGPVVNDLVHLIAELLDNATNASPPDTSVTLSSAVTDDGGLLVEIIDCGTGLPPGELHAINERLASPPVVDVSVSRQMGLFVVGRLAARHRIQVRLRQQRGEFGITAAVLLPSSLVCIDAPMPPDSLVPAGSYASPDSRTTADSLVSSPPRSSPLVSSALGRRARTGAAWSGTNTELPIQVSVVEGPSGGDLFSPSSIGNLVGGNLTGGTLTVQGRSPQRSAEQEWHDLFGHEGPPPGGQGATTKEPPAQAESPRLSTPVGADSLSSANGSPAVGPDQAPQVREEIFEAVSAWFQDRRSSPVAGSAPALDADEMATPPAGIASPVASSAAPPEDSAPEWRSAADEGWHAANALRTSVDFDLTPAGLPRRRPRAHLVPGAAGPSTFSPMPPMNGATRTPDDVRGRLTSYQRGLQYGRHARFAPDEQSARSHVRQGNPGEDQ